MDLGRRYICSAPQSDWDLELSLAIRREPLSLRRPLWLRSPLQVGRPQNGNQGLAEVRPRAAGRVLLLDVPEPGGRVLHGGEDRAGLQSAALGCCLEELSSCGVPRATSSKVLLKVGNHQCLIAFGLWIHNWTPTNLFLSASIKIRV